VPRGVSATELDVGRLQRDLPAIRHHVPRVHDEVHDHLLQLARIDADPPEIGARHEGQVDVLADQALQQIGRPRDQLVERHDLRLKHLLPAEREELTRQRGGPVGGLLDEQKVAAQGIGVLQSADRKLAAGPDDGEQVVEVMGDAARELADALHALSMAQLLFELLACRDVLDDADRVTGFARGVARLRRRDMDPYDGAVLVDVALLHRVGQRLVLHHGAAQREVELQVFGMGDVLEAQICQLTRAVPDHGSEFFVDAQEAAVVGNDGNADCGLLERRAEALFALAKRRLGGFPLGDVLDDGDRDARVGQGAAHDGRREVDPHG
jgi:hypothetical protein